MAAKYAMFGVFTAVFFMGATVDAQVPSIFADGRGVRVPAGQVPLAQRVPGAANVRPDLLQNGQAAQLELLRARALYNRLALEYQRRLAAQQFAGRGVPAFGFNRPGFYQPRVIGYVPNIVWLPTGTTLNTAASVSPDGRYVRVSAQPFFSSVRAVHTYNLQTGEMRRIR